ncbi:PKD domain-containing protein [Methanoregula sp.]|uniref:PKD domain-containing protein n=1 Tax=Methanoregula sp. TaxID=2052170 RepID=UPI003C1C5BB1
MINRQKILFLIGALIIAGIFFLGIIGPFQSIITPHISYSTPYGAIIVPAALPETPDNLTLYKITPEPYDMAFFSVIHVEQTRSNVTSETDAPTVIQKILKQYGGLPHDAKMTLDKTQYLEEKSGSTGQTIAKFPTYTDVQYGRIINGIPISGDGGYISIELGTNGELLYLDKIWRTVIPSGTVHVISAPQAIERLQHGEILGNPPQCGCGLGGCPCDLTVTKIVPTYYEQGRNISQEYLDPVWVFAGTLSDGNIWYYSVYAWQFANFTEAPISSTNPLSVQFTDTSEASPTRWLWDFGDGTNTSVQNPVHSYESAGVYNVTLTAWNDLGSDTVMKNIFVQNSPVETPALNSPLNTTPGTQGTSNI